MGSGGKVGGSPRGLATAHRRLDVTEMHYAPQMIMLWRSTDIELEKFLRPAGHKVAIVQTASRPLLVILPVFRKLKCHLLNFGLSILITFLFDWRGGARGLSPHLSQGWYFSSVQTASRPFIEIFPALRELEVLSAQFLTFYADHSSIKSA